MAGMRSAMRSPMRSALDQALGTAYMSLANQALAILRKFGTDAHVYLPGANGVAVSGLPTNNYTLSNGSTGYSAVDGTAGLVLDGAGSVGSELVTNGGFDGGTTGWSDNGNASKSVVAGELLITSTTTGACIVSEPITTVAGRLYVVTATARQGTSVNGVNVAAMAAQFGSTINSASTSSTSASPLTFQFTATGTTTWVGPRIVNSLGVGETAYFDNISVREVTGIHATQSTTANKPAVRRGLYNLLMYSNDFTVWGKVGAPTVTASSITRTITGTTYATGPSVTKSASAAPYSVIGKFTAGTGRYAAMRAQSTYPNYADAVFDLQTGTVYSSAANAGFTGQVASIVKSANGECTCCVSFTTDADTAVTAYVSLNSNGVAVDGTDSSATSSFTSGGVAVAQGVWTAAQALAEGGIPLTTSAAASNPSAGRYSWQFDGSNDSLALGSVPFQMSDDHCVIAGWRADVFQNSVVAPSHTSNTARYGSIGTSSGGNGIITEWYDGTQYVNHQTVVAKGSVNVTSATKASGTVKSRNNGVSFGSGAAFSTAVQGNDAAISPTSALGIFTGAIGPVILIKGTVSDADLLTLERWVASQTHNGPQF